MHADPAFRAEMEAAKGELAAVRAKGLKPTRDCQAEADALAHPSLPLDGESKILQSWQDDYPVAQLRLLPEKQREHAVGFIADAKTFEDAWKAFKPGEAVPEIDFKANLVVFTRNVDFYNRTSIGMMKLANGVLEIVAMETMSALPIEDKAAMAMAVIPRAGVKFIQVGQNRIPVTAKAAPQEAFAADPLQASCRIERQEVRSLCREVLFL